MGFFDWLFGPKKELQGEPKNKKISKKKDYGRHNIVGVGYENMDGTKRQANIKKCIRITNGSRGYDHDVWYSADMEPDNKHDSRAIVVSAREEWETNNGESREKYIGILGYLPKDLAHEIYEDTKNAEGPFWVYLGSEQFDEFENDKGKTLVTINFAVSARWDEWEDRKASSGIA